LPNRGENIHAILLRKPVSSDKSAFRTLVHYDKFLLTHRPIERLHHSITLGRTIPGVHINVFAPQALRAMIGITVSHHQKPAMITREILFPSLKFL
jgi:hypothetical protein